MCLGAHACLPRLGLDVDRADGERRAVKISHTHVAIASLTVSLGSIVFGVVAKTMQQVTVTITNDAEAPLLAPQDRLPRGTQSLREFVAQLGFRLTTNDGGDLNGDDDRELPGAE